MIQIRRTSDRCVFEVKMVEAIWVVDHSDVVDFAILEAVFVKPFARDAVNMVGADVLIEKVWFMLGGVLYA